MKYPLAASSLEKAPKLSEARIPRPWLLLDCCYSRQDVNPKYSQSSFGTTIETCGRRVQFPMRLCRFTPADSVSTSGAYGAYAPLAFGSVDGLQSYALASLGAAALQGLTAFALRQPGLSGL